MKNKKKLFRNLILFLAIILLTFYIIFKDQSITEILKMFQNAEKKYVIIAILSMSLFFCCDALNIGTTLKMLGEKSKFFRNIRYSLIGFFFSSVTPAASGGQPMQIYYMTKYNISVANSTVAFLINLTCMQIVTISIALISVIFNYMYLNTLLIWLFILGIALNSSALTLLIISLYSKRMTNGLIRIFIKILTFFKVKNIEEKKEKIEKELIKYQTGATFMKQHKTIILRILLTTYVQFFFYYSISYWIYKALGMSGYNIIQISSVQAILYGTVSGIPSPGAVGVSEGGFLEIFKTIYPKEMISGAMLLSRGVNFYLFVVLSAVVVLIHTIKEKKEEKLLEEKNIIDDIE